MSLVDKITEEIRAKISEYEISQASFLNTVSEWGEMFRVKRPKRKSQDDRTFSNPRLTDYFRSANTLGTLSYRMQTSQEPYFEVIPISVMEASDQLSKIQAVHETQLDAANYKPNLLVANTGMFAFGTQIVEESYRIVGINRFGRRIPVTTFVPRSLLQVGFDRGALDLDDADWLYTQDLASKAGLMRLAEESKDLGTQWNREVLEFAAKDEEKSEELPAVFLNRLKSLSLLDPKLGPLRKEFVNYYGKLEALGDGREYICTLISRKHLARFEANKNQSGQRNFRVAYNVKDPLSLDPLGLGIGHVAAGLHRDMDANRQRTQDGIIMMTYNIMERLRSAGIDDIDLKLRPLQIIDTEERGGLTPLKLSEGGPEAGLKLEELLRAEFQNVTGATPTLQAQITEATASEVSLAQNEAVRNISVRSELAAEPLVRKHLLEQHANNIEHANEPMGVNKGGYMGVVYPSDLKADVDFRIKITTDKDYKPERLKQLIQAFQIAVSTKSNHPELSQVPILPIFSEIMRALGVPVNLQSGQGQSGLPSPSLPMNLPMLGQSAGGAPSSIIQTPVGPTLGSPS